MVNLGYVNPPLWGPDSFNDGAGMATLTTFDRKPLLQWVLAIAGGGGLILLALLIRLPVLAVGSVGLIIIAGHNLLDPLLPTIAGSPPGSSCM